MNRLLQKALAAIAALSVAGGISLAQETPEKLAQKTPDNFGQLLDPHISKGIFCRLMEQNFLLMFLPKFSGITGLAIGNIGLAGLGIIDDMGSQDGDLRHAFLRCLDFCG